MTDFKHILRADIDKVLDVEAGLADSIARAHYNAVRREITARLDVDAGLMSAWKRAVFERARKPRRSSVRDHLDAYLSDDFEGFDAQVAWEVSELTHRTLERLTRPGFIRPSLVSVGTGDPLFSFVDLVLLLVAGRAIEAGATRPSLARVMPGLVDLGRGDPYLLAEVTLVVGFASIRRYESARDVVDVYDDLTGRHVLELGWIMDEVARRIASRPGLPARRSEEVWPSVPHLRAASHGPIRQAPSGPGG